MKLEKIEKYIRNSYHNSSDLVIRNIKIKRTKLLYIYLEGVSSDDKISNFFMKDVSSYLKHRKIITSDLFKLLENSIPNSHIIIDNKLEDIFRKLASGYTIIFVENNDNFISIETRSTLDRGVTELRQKLLLDILKVLLKKKT